MIAVNHPEFLGATAGFDPVLGGWGRIRPVYRAAESLLDTSSFAVLYEGQDGRRRRKPCRQIKGLAIFDNVARQRWRDGFVLQAVGQTT
jgi:hypothetical protein